MTALILGAACLWALWIVAMRTHPMVANRWNVALVASVLAVLTVAAVVTSDSRVDRPVYVAQFRIQDAADTPWTVNSLFEQDRAFNLFLWLLARVFAPTETVLYMAVASCVVAGFMFAAWLLLPHWAALGAFVTVVAMGLVDAYASVAIRQGLATACLLAAVSLSASGKWRWPAWSLLVTAALFHWTALPLAVGLVVLRRWTPSFRVQAVTWCALAAGFILGLPERLLSSVGWVPQMTDFTSPEAYRLYGTEGLRLDFLAVSAAIFLIAVWGHRQIPGDATYRHLTAAFVLFNSAFLLLGFVAFSDRLAAYSWFLAPLLLWYPLAKRERGTVLAPVTVVAALGVGLALGTLPTLLA